MVNSGSYRAVILSPGTLPPYRTQILAILAQVFPVQVKTDKSTRKTISFRFPEPRDPSLLKWYPNSANPGEQTGARALFSFEGVAERITATVNHADQIICTIKPCSSTQPSTTVKRYQPRR